MYLVGKGHEHLGPGTSLVQRINWTTGDEMRVVAGRRGMGCASCSGTCGQKCGMGLFDSGFDVSGWGWPEMLIAAFGGYMVLSTIFTTKRAVSRVRTSARKRSSRNKRKAELQEQLRKL